MQLYFRDKKPPDRELAMGLLFKPVKTWLVILKVSLRKPSLYSLAFYWIQLLCAEKVMGIGTELSRKLIIQSNHLNQRFEYCKSYFLLNKMLCIISLQKQKIPPVQMPLLIS